MKLEFFGQVFKKHSKIKFHPVEAELFQAGGRTGRQA
jgi:hypothetical protein